MTGKLNVIEELAPEQTQSSNDSINRRNALDAVQS